jgi:predicted AAA+ superfamily ATPase
MNVSASALSERVNPHLADSLLEGFVAGEIRRQMTWSYEMVELSHCRDQNAGEVDLTLETPDGRVVGIEVKATSTPGHRDAKGLIYLRDSLGSRFISGIILHTGSSSALFGDRITALPLDALWKVRGAYSGSIDSKNSWGSQP